MPRGACGHTGRGTACHALKRGGQLLAHIDFRRGGEAQVTRVDIALRNQMRGEYRVDRLIAPDRRRAVPGAVPQRHEGCWQQQDGDVELERVPERLSGHAQMAAQLGDKAAKLQRRQKARQRGLSARVQGVIAAVAVHDNLCAGTGEGRMQFVNREMVGPSRHLAVQKRLLQPGQHRLSLARYILDVEMRHVARAHLDPAPRVADGAAIIRRHHRGGGNELAAFERGAGKAGNRGAVIAAAEHEAGRFDCAPGRGKQPLLPARGGRPRCNRPRRGSDGPDRHVAPSSGASWSSHRSRPS